MIQPPARRAPHQGNPYQQHAPNAALLIDFDNVTMGIRSDLGKELKSLLNSEVIRGKVAVQRAYADWRRYPQYIVPLAESSIDLIFAPAYGSSKKNATDLRMAIDAIELVFTRPEIGTYILMTGDSDFSSCVLKLKEYGKYVIGVGMRESSSDLLIQNCDEYYSYHALSGLTRADEVTESREDPWVLVKRAVQQMAANGDVMRTDRLKQVMLEIDSSFDEKEIGYTKFSRFVHEAGNKGVIRLRKGENGQYEIVGGEGDAAAPAAERRPRESSDSSDGRGRGRGRGRDRDESRREEPVRAERALAPTTRAPEPVPPAAPVPSAPAAAAAPAAPEASAPAASPTPPSAAQPGRVDDLESAYGLLQQAVKLLGGSNGKTVRDGDVKRRMLELVPSFDETTLGFPKFTRFLRQAHDAEAIDLQRANGGNYEVSLATSGKRFSAPSTAAAEPPRTEAQAAAAQSPTARQEQAAAQSSPARQEQAASPATTAAAQPTRAGMGGMRGRKSSRGASADGAPPILPGQAVQVSKPVVAAPEVETPAPAPEAEASAAEEKPVKKSRARRGRGRGRGKDQDENAAPEAAGAPAPEASAPEASPAAQAAPAPEAAPVAEAKPMKANVTARSRRGRRGGPDTSEGPPPILPGQSVTAPVSRTPEAAPPAEEKPAKKSRSRAPRKTTAAAAKAPAATPEPTFSATRLGLPQGRESIESYLTTSYKGVGKKTAESLLDAFGDDVFDVLENSPDRVREVVGDRRATTLLEGWKADHDQRRGTAQAPAAADPAEGEAPEDGKRSRTRRGGRGGRGRKRTEPTPG